MDGHQKLTRRCCGIFLRRRHQERSWASFACIHVQQRRWSEGGGAPRHAALLREPVELPQKSQHSDRVRVRRMECLGTRLARVDSRGCFQRGGRPEHSGDSHVRELDSLAVGLWFALLPTKRSDIAHRMPLPKGPRIQSWMTLPTTHPCWSWPKLRARRTRPLPRLRDVAKKGHKLAMRRTGGFLVACTPTGTIADLVEFFGAESLAQRYRFLARLKTTFPELHVDDACHLRRYASNREGHSTFAQTLSYPDVAFVIDKFHARGHVDPWCSQHCAPRTTENAQLVCNANTSICEITFAWLARYKHVVRKMDVQVLCG